MDAFVPTRSIVRRIWGDADTVLLVFAGSAAEFALNRAVDWLFFTGALPRNPVGRLFSTARFAQDIVFVDDQTAAGTLARIRAIHDEVQARRGIRIPDWAHRDVLYMLIDYSERAHELLHGPLTTAERGDLYDVFRRVGEGLSIPGLPATYDAWRADRQLHLARDLVFSAHSAALFAGYRRELGPWRYGLLRRVQSVLLPEAVRRLLEVRRGNAVRRALATYGASARYGLRPVVQHLLLPRAYLNHVRALDRSAEDRVPRYGAGR
jgi:uncharacterized protein (DUF2236 family)